MPYSSWLCSFELWQIQIWADLFACVSEQERTWMTRCVSLFNLLVVMEKIVNPVRHDENLKRTLQQWQCIINGKRTKLMRFQRWVPVSGVSKFLIQRVICCRFLFNYSPFITLTFQAGLPCHDEKNDEMPRGYVTLFLTVVTLGLGRRLMLNYEFNVTFKPAWTV